MIIIVIVMLFILFIVWAFILASLRLNKSDEEEFDDIINKMIKK